MSTYHNAKKQLKKFRRLYHYLFGDRAPFIITSASVQVGVETIPVGFGINGMPMVQASPVFEEVTKASLAAKVFELSERVLVMERRRHALKRAFESDSESYSSSS